MTDEQQKSRLSRRPIELRWRDAIYVVVILAVQIELVREYGLSAIWAGLVLVGIALVLFQVGITGDEFLGDKPKPITRPRPMPPI